MGLLSGLTKLGIAKKVVDEARKPSNQRKAKELVGKMMRQRGGANRTRER